MHPTGKDFSPLQLTSEENGPIEPLQLTEDSHQQSTTGIHNVQGTEENDAAQPPADELTPLLPLLPRQEQNGRKTHRPSRGSMGSGVGLSRTATRDEAFSSAIDDEFGEILTRNRSRLNSYPVMQEPEAIKKRDEQGSIVIYVEDRGITEADDQERTHDADSKYMHVGPTRFWFVFLTILLGYFVACFDITLMASIHPVITSYFHASNEASWLTTAFMITNTGFQPLWGRLSDTIGRKSVYLTVLTIFAATNLWCGLANSIGSFIAARAVCGIGAGGLMSMGLVVTNDLVKVEHRGTFVSYINVAFGVGAACGAAFGGVISDSIGFRWTFGIQVPILVVCGIAGFFTIPNQLGPMLITKADNKQGQNPGWMAVKNFDSLGLSCLVCAVAFFILFFNVGGNELPWSHPIIIVFIVLAVVLSGAVAWIERRAKQPIMPLHLLVTHPYANLTFANFLAGVASNTVLFNVPLWFQAVELSSPSASGLRLAAPAIGGSIAGVLTGYVITRTRRLKIMLVIGSIIYLAGSIALYFIDRRLPEAAKIALITPTPLSQGFIYPGSMMAAFATSPQEEQGVVTTTLSLWRNLGIVVGVSISSLVFQNVLNLRLDQLVQGPQAEHYIEISRSSVRAVTEIPHPYQDQVRDAYAQALKLSFVTAIVASALLLIIMVPMKLPRMQKGAGGNVAAE